MSYRLVALARTEDGKIHMLCPGEVHYELTEDSAWEDLQAVIDDPDLPPPEPVQQVAADIGGPDPVADFVGQFAEETYGPLAGMLARNGVMGVQKIFRKRK